MRQALTGYGVVLDLVALFHRPPEGSTGAGLDRARRVVALEQVDNPANLGAIVRSAVALGLDGLVLDRTSSDPFARRAVRAAMGTVFRCPWARIDPFAATLAGWAAAGTRVLAMTPAPGARPLDEVELAADERAVVVFGAERTGLSEAVLAVAEPVRIPIRVGVDSLNVAAAAAIACYWLGSSG